MPAAFLRSLRRRLLTRTPGLARAVLAARRMTSSAGVRRIIVTEAQVVRRYGATVRRLDAADFAEAGYRPLVTTIDGARVTAAPVSVWGPDGALLWAYAPQLKRRPYQADALWRRAGPPVPLAGDALFAGSDGFSYYHWLLGTLPRLAVGLAAYPGGYAAYLVNPRHKGRDRFQLETLALLGVPLERVAWLERGSHLACGSLALPEDPTLVHQTCLKAWARAVLRATFLPLAQPSATMSRRLCVSRAVARRRRLVGEERLSEALAAEGFDRVILEELPFLEQVRLFAEAQWIVGLHGAGLANLVFARAGANVLELALKAWRNPCFANLAVQGRLRYRAIPVDSVGPRRGFQADALLTATAQARVTGYLSS